jgi:thiol-disulfide isomerase/thioredoxin
VPPRSYDGETLDGRALDPSDFQQRPIIAVAWATWCEPCRGTLTAIQAWVDVSRLAPSAVGMVERSDADRAREVLRHLDISFPSVIAGDRGGWGIEAVPAVWVMSSDGTVVAHRQGSLDRDWLAEGVYEATFGEPPPPDDQSRLPNVMRVRCTEAGAEVLTPEVETSPDGVRVVAVDGSDRYADGITIRPLGWPVFAVSSGSSGIVGEFVRAVPEGAGIVSCYRDGISSGRMTPDPREGEATVEVLDPNGHFTPWIPSCPLEKQVAFDRGERVELAGIRGADAVRALIPAIRPTDEVVPASYGSGEWEKSFFSIFRDGDVIGSVWIDTERDGTAAVTSGFACSGSGIEDWFDVYPAWEEG